MEGERDDEAAFAGLDDAVVVHHEVTGCLLDQSRFAPRLALIGGKANMRAAINPTVLDAVKHRQLAAREPQQRHAHHIVATGVFYHSHRRTPSAALIIRMDADDARRAFIRRAAVELRVAEKDATRLQRGERAFRVAWMLGRRIDVQRDDAFGANRAG